MAKRKSAKNRKTNVSTRIGFSIIALVVLVLGLVVLTNYNASPQTQTDQSHAAMLNNQSSLPCPWKYVCVQSSKNTCTYYAERQVCN